MELSVPLYTTLPRTDVLIWTFRPHYLHYQTNGGQDTVNIFIPTLRTARTRACVGREDPIIAHHCDLTCMPTPISLSGTACHFSGGPARTRSVPSANYLFLSPCWQ